ncbi:MAG: glycosyltransferase family 39 protein [Salinibacterium sp.]|nr:glycosyltransferase family 39 protein [Salinibacterium sp.]
MTTLMSARSDQSASTAQTGRGVIRELLHRPALLLGVLGAVVGFLGSWIPSYWGDEAASVMSATRSLPSLLSELSTIDSVHGVYYAFLHIWVSAFGSSELSTRLPSAIATGLMVSGTVVLVRGFAGTRPALLAGAILILLPRTTAMAIEARSYALGAAVAVWVTVLLFHLLRRRLASTWIWVGYSVAIAGSIYLFLYLGLLLLVHGVAVLVLYRDRIWHWLRGAAGALLLATPIVVSAYHERQQISFLAHRHYATFLNVAVSQWFESAAVAIIGWALILVAIAAAVPRIRSGCRGVPALVVLAVAWLLLPTAVLLTGNATVSPMYNVRYLTFSTPAAAILIALGVVALARRLMPRWRALLAAVLLGTLLVACAPGYLSQRTPFAKDGGSDLRQVAEYIGAHSVTGDAIVFDQTTKPSRDPRLALRLYPSDFAAVTDVGLVTPFNKTAGLWDVTAPLADLSLGGYPTVWAVELGHGSDLPPDVAYLEAHGYVVESSILIHRTTIYHLTKE